jgi:dCMP deaminase
MSSGYNGVPAGITHCTDEPCPFAEHQHGSGCFATHAETNAIAQCRNVDEIWTVFTTSYPCVECFKLIMNTGCKRVVYIQDYPATREQVERINSLAPCPIEFVQLSPYMDPSGRFISAEPS